MKQIIAAVDFSEVTDSVLDYAGSIARAYAARLILLHVAAPDPDFVGYEAGPQVVRDARAKELGEEHRGLQQKAVDLTATGVNAEAYLVEGPTVETILERAEHFEADLIVMGSHGHGAIYHALVGSISEGVIRRAKVPVLIVPASLSVPTESD